MDPLNSLLRPVAKMLNRNIEEITPARELCAELAGTVVAVRVRNTGLATHFIIDEASLDLVADTERNPDVVITGSLLTLARMAGDSGEAAIRDGDLDLTGDAETAQQFQQLLEFAKPDLEEEMSGVIGDVAANRLGKMARGLARWGREARSTMGDNIREYLQEESRDAPSRYEVDRFTQQVDTLRDDVERAAARLNRILESR
ncbi:MAG: SCP2 sterol-binding domain-containing protein [Pseudomonadota bacterium]